MGKKLKGKEIGKGICQKCDGTYLARFVNCRGKRAIERNVNPKVLQKLLGHSSIQMTMDRYVHVSEDSIENFKKTPNFFDQKK